ncbi:MAG: ImmA/IrrE family metallo-endopeptidase [Myxococcota bacterium]
MPRRLHEFIGARLRVARLFRGMKQSHLADAVEVTRQYIYKIERGDAQPRFDLVEAMAEEVAFPVPFFGTPPAIDVREEDCNFRKRVTTPVGVRSQAVAHLMLLAEGVALLEKQVALPRLRIPEIAVDSPEGIERAAEQCRSEWGLRHDAPIQSMVRVVEHAGAVVAELAGSTDKIDAFSWPGRRPVVVRSTFKKSTTRARMDFAHELGHLVMHAGLDDTDDPQLEVEANRFGSAFLLPRAGFMREFPRTSRISWPDVFAMKRRWRVAVSAIVRRAFDLHLIDAREYRRANVFISKQGWRRGEPEEPRDREEPEVIRLAMDHLMDKGVPPWELAKQLHWSPDTFEEVMGVAPLAPAAPVYHLRIPRKGDSTPDAR